MTSQPRLFDVLRNRGGSTKVYGRDEELGALKVAFDRVAKDDSLSSEVLLIHGPSGCGKLAIVKALQQWRKDECGNTVKTFFGTGKYDQLVNNEPFAAIVTASNELYESVLKTRPNTVKRFNDRFKSIVDGDATVLSNAIPALTELLRVESNNSKNTKTVTRGQTQDMASATQAFTRFKQLWRSMLLAIACCTNVVVFFLDNVQWADANSLNLIHTMTKTTTTRNILFVCAFRDDTQDGNVDLCRVHHSDHGSATTRDLPRRYRRSQTSLGFHGKEHGFDGRAYRADNREHGYCSWFQDGSQEDRQSQILQIPAQYMSVLRSCYKKKAQVAKAPYLLLVAESMVDKPRRKSWEDIQQAYLEAMEAARHNGGFIFVEAYGYERLAKHAQDRSDEPKALFYLQEALAMYTRWGATVKMTELSERLEGRR